VEESLRLWRRQVIKGGRRGVGVAEDHKYEVLVKRLDKPLKVPRELSKKLSGLSRKLLLRMKREAGDCPVMGREVPFLQCYFCPNFVRRVMGVVHCRGLPLSEEHEA